jgi:23S rRNA (adenine-N6)-dimethyltransferase
MARRTNKRKLLAQNFLKDPRLVRKLVRLSSIARGDTVYEIGPGRGVITEELSRTAREVIAVEKDRSLVRHLRERFRAPSNVRIFECDFLRFTFPHDGDYKIFASIPYNATAAIVRKILEAPRGLSDAWLIMQREPARKFAGLPTETLFSLLAKPRFEFRILHSLRRTDFHPVPDVDSVLLHIRRRCRPLIEQEDVQTYRDFVSYGFNRWKPSLRSAFKGVFTYPQWKRLSSDLGFSRDATPTQLTFAQWLGLYHGYKKLRAGSSWSFLKGRVRDDPQIRRQGYRFPPADHSHPSRGRSAVQMAGTLPAVIVRHGQGAFR